MDATYDFFDHTADLGIRVRAATRPALIAPAGQALYAVIGELAIAEPGATESWNLTGDDAAVLLRDYLADLLFLFERDQRVIVAPDVSAFEDGGLRVDAATVAIDPDRSVFFREVKAITYHELAIRPIEGGFEATLIVDI
ncbi:MAG: archease [Phycisphaerae bacterium]